MTPVSPQLRAILGPASLRSEYQQDSVCVKLGDVAYDVMIDPLYEIGFLMRSAGSLLILAYEKCPDELAGAQPLWQFLRHCRNAAAHDGLFDIKPPKKKPLPPAVWGRFRIELALNDTPLFKDGMGPGMLSPGDPIRLLWDIEQAYPNISA